LNSEKEWVKIQFYDPDVGYENLWACPLDGDLYRIESGPYFIYGVSLHDVVRARPDQEGWLQFLEVTRASANRTLRIRPETFALADEQGKDTLKRLQAFGCKTEVLEPRLIAVNVPSDADLSEITDYLAAYGIPWEYANPTFEELETS
jgi:Domain of unknown function (DUF4265)